MPMDTNCPWILNKLKTMAIGMISVVFVVTEMDATRCKKIVWQDSFLLSLVEGGLMVTNISIGKIRHMLLNMVNTISLVRSTS